MWFGRNRVPLHGIAVAGILGLLARPAAAGTAIDTVHDLRPTEAVMDAEDIIPMPWLGRRISVDQAEAGNPGIDDERVARFPEAALPFGFQHGRWLAFKANLRPGDELWTFASPPDSWQHLAGRAGIAIMRGGRVVRTFVTIVN